MGLQVQKGAGSKQEDLPRVRRDEAMTGANPSNSDLVAEARRLSEAATPGPWEHNAAHLNGQDWWQVGRPTIRERGKQLPFPSVADLRSEADAEFIARARTLLPELAQQLEQAKQRTNVLREWIGVGQADRILRAALTPDEGADPGGR